MDAPAAPNLTHQRRNLPLEQRGRDQFGTPERHVPERRTLWAGPDLHTPSRDATRPIVRAATPPPRIAGTAGGRLVEPSPQAHRVLEPACGAGLAGGLGPSGGGGGGGGGECRARTPAPPSAAARGAVAAPSAGVGSAHHPSSLDRGSGASPAYSAPGEVFEATQDRLQVLASGFSIFERQLEQETKARKVVELAHIQTIHSQSARVEQLLQQEAERASECQRSLQRSLEGRLVEAQGKLESLFLDKFDSVHSALAALDERLHTVEGSFAQACESYIHDMREENLSTRAESMEFNRSFREELSKRHDTEDSINARISELQQRTDHRLASEQQVREQRWAQLAKDIPESNWAWEAANKDYQDQLAAKVHRCKAGLVAATRTRAQADDDIVAALNHYTKVLQDAVTSVSRGALLSVTL